MALVAAQFVSVLIGVTAKYVRKAMAWFSTNRRIQKYFTVGMVEEEKKQEFSLWCLLFPFAFIRDHV